VKRWQDLADEVRWKRGLASDPYVKARDLDSVLNKSYDSNGIGNNLESAPEDLISDNFFCILHPETTDGPYYVTGEMIRKNMTDGEKGIDMALDIQIIDVATCEPLPTIYVDIWQCNATGVYSSIVANGNADPRDNSDPNNPAFRGLQKADDMGILQYHTIFPGHYVGEKKKV
jgi:protocatechuate 3,4-dioxygenase beta subunit